jgi:two-component system KDP operon response regulator KdpE
MADWPEAPADLSALVVDDSTAFRTMLAKLLRVDGWKVLEAATRERALELALVHRPAVIILDWVLAREDDGLEVLRALRRRRGTAATPVVMVSAFRDDADDEALAMSAGATLFFAKLEVGASTSAFLRHLHAAVRSRAQPVPLGGGFLLDPAAGGVTGPGHSARLNPQEARLLEVLARARGRLVTHEALWTEVWRQPHARWRHLLNNRMSTLRAKLGAFGPRVVCRKKEGFLLNQPL